MDTPMERVEHDDSLEFERVDGLIVGRAAALPDEPRALKKATRVLREWTDEQAFQDVILAMDKRRNAKPLRDKLPYGRADDAPGDSIVIQPGGSLDRVSPFVRLPEGLPSRATREPTDDAFTPRLGPPPSFDISQPPGACDFSRSDDEAQDEAPSPGGFDFSRPDDDA